MNLEITISIICIYQDLKKQFHWPTKVDTCWSSNIVCVIEAPVLSSSSLWKYIISENDYKKITEAHDKLII